jgi:hypothetical protein
MGMYNTLNNLNYHFQKRQPTMLTSYVKTPSYFIIIL